MEPGDGRGEQFSVSKRREWKPFLSAEKAVAERVRNCDCEAPADFLVLRRLPVEKAMILVGGRLLFPSRCRM